MLLAIPAFVVFIGIELWWAKRKSKKLYRFNDAITNLNIGVGNQVIGLFSKAMLIWVYVWIYNNFAFFEQPATWWSFIICMFAFDFCFYWAHRWSHGINFFWGAHIVHHQSEEYNLSVALRQSWFHHVLMFFVFLPLPLLGFDPLLFFGVAAANTLYQFWIHTKAIKKLPDWIEFFWNTPSHHRVHHGIDPKYIDKNHAGMFIIWDKMFGTFVKEEEEPTYGITTQLKSWNPIWANLHYYVEITSHAMKMSRWQDRIKMIFAPPGWLPEELGGFQAPQEVHKPTHKVYDIKTSKLFNYYVLTQFVLIIAGLMLYMYRFEELSLFYKLLFLGIMLISTLICGAIFEGRKWVIIAEYGKLTLTLFAINVLYYFQYIDWFLVMLISSSVGFILLNVWFTLSWMLKRKAQELSVG